MTEVFGIEIALPLILVGPLLIVLFGALGLAIGRLILYVVAHGVRKTDTHVDDVIVHALGRPIFYASALGGAWLALHALPLPAEMDPYVNRGWVLLATLLLLSVALRLINGITRDVLRQSPTVGPASGIIRVIGRVIVISLGLVMILQSLGIAVEPLIASLGIGSLAVALAAKDTLANLFAGVYIFADRPIRVGDYVKLESGEEGIVHQVGWRATRIRMLSNNLVVVPNEKLVQSIVTNYDLPESQMSLVMPISVSYAADPLRIMDILVEEARGAVGQVPGLLGEPEPFARFIGGFGQDSLDFSLIVRVATFVDQYVVQSELRVRILARFRREGIEIPFPQRTIHVPRLERALEAQLAASRASSNPGGDRSIAGTAVADPPGAGAGPEADGTPGS